MADAQKVDPVESSLDESHLTPLLPKADEIKATWKSKFAAKLQSIKKVKVELDSIYVVQ